MHVTGRTRPAPQGAGQGKWRISNAVDWFVDRHPRDGGGDPSAFQDPWRSLTYAELETATRRFAGALRAAGIGREQRVVLLLQDTIDFPIAFWGAMRAGVVPVPINTLLTAGTVALHPGRQPGGGGGDLRRPDRDPGRSRCRQPRLRHVIVSQPDGSAAGSRTTRLDRLRRLPRQRRPGDPDRRRLAG